jgi:hypothetical protein
MNSGVLPIQVVIPRDAFIASGAGDELEDVVVGWVQPCKLTPAIAPVIIHKACRRVQWWVLEKFIDRLILKFNGKF